MRVLKALLFLIPLIVLGVILAVGILDNKTVKRNLVELANKKGLPAEVEDLQLSVHNGRAVFQGLSLADPETGFTAKVSRVELTLDEEELLNGRRSICLFATNAVITIPCDLFAALFGGQAKLPFSQGGALLNYSAEKVDAGKIPWLLSKDQKSRDPLFLSVAKLQGGFIVFQGKSAPLVWEIEELQGKELAIPPEKAQSPEAFWSARLRGRPETTFKGEVSSSINAEGKNIKTMNFSLTDLPAEVLPDLLPDEIGAWQCKGGRFSASGQLNFNEKDLLPGSVKISLRNLTVNTTQGPKVASGKKLKASIPALSLEDANLDLEVKVDDKEPYFHLEEAWENQKTKVQSGRFEMMLDLKF